LCLKLGKNYDLNLTNRTDNCPRSQHNTTTNQPAPRAFRRRIAISGLSVFGDPQMKSIEEFLSELSSSQRPACLDFANRPPQNYFRLPEAVRQAVNRGWQTYPANQVARISGKNDLLIGDSSCDLCCLEKFAAEYPGCEWRVAVGPSSLCVLEMTGPECKRSLAALSREEEECFTLRAERGDTLWAFFTWPGGLVLRRSARKLLGGARILGAGGSCVIPPSGGSLYINPSAEVEPIPLWLRELAFQNPDSPPKQFAPQPAHSPRSVPSRSGPPLTRPLWAVRKGFPGQSQAGLGKGFRIHRRL
jgi:hypothetical protein